MKIRRGVLEKSSKKKNNSKKKETEKITIRSSVETEDLN